MRLMEGATARMGGYKYGKEKNMASVVKKVTDYVKEIPGATKELAKEAGQAVSNAVKTSIEKNMAVNQAMRDDLKCPQCNGTGKDNNKKPCKPCKGTGWKNGSPI